MSKLHVKKDDKVMVITGKNKGKKGKVLKVFPEENSVLVEGLNLVKRHTKPKPPKVPQGGIIEKSLPINVSNVMLVCNNCGNPSKTETKITGDGKKERICKKCKQTT